MTATLTPAAERILVAASDLFYERGIRAVGVDLVAEVAGTTKKTIYDRFGSKDALVAAYLGRRAERWQQHLRQSVARRRSGRARTLGTFDAAETWMAASARGCAFVNAFAEYGPGPNPVVDVVRAEKAWMRDWFTDNLAGAGVSDPGRAADVVHLLYEGALVTLTAAADPDALRTARRAAERLLAD